MQVISYTAMPPLPRTGPTGKRIMRLVVDAFDLESLRDLTTQRRQHHLAVARFAAMYVMRRATDKSYPEIGRLLGNRDHGTIIYGERRAEFLMASNEAFRQRVVRVFRALEADE